MLCALYTASGDAFRRAGMETPQNKSLHQNDDDLIAINAATKTSHLLICKFRGNLSCRYCPNIQHG